MKARYKISILSAALLVEACAYMPFKRTEAICVEWSGAQFAHSDTGVGDLGSVYHYVKSNLDGSNASDVWIRMSGLDRTESLKVYPGAERRGYIDLVIARYSLDTLMATRLEGWFVRPTGARTLNATCQIEGEQATVSIGAQSYRFALGRIPSFNYNFDWCDLAFAYRHLIDPERDFTVGVIAPDSLMVFGYVGDVTFAYEGYEERGGRHCRAYGVSGSAFAENSGGRAWFDAATETLVEFEMRARNNPAFNSFRFALAGVESMDDASWERFVADTAVRATAKK